METLLAACTKSFLGYAERRGLDRAVLLAEAGLGEEDLADPNARVEGARDLALWTAVISALGDEALGLDYACQRAGQTFHGIVALVAHARLTVEQSLHAAATYHRLLRDDGAATFTVSEGVGALRWIPSRTSSWLEPMEDAFLGCCTVLAREWTGREVAPLRLRFQRSRPRNPEPFERLFGCPMEFGARMTEIAFSSEVLALPIRPLHAEVASHLAIAAESYVGRLGEARSVRAQVLAILEEIGPADQGEVARRLGWSVRTLQRRLTEAGTAYQTVIDEYRHYAALTLMKERSLTVIQIAHQTGFSDVRAFRRALRRWRREMPEAGGRAVVESPKA